MKRFHFSLDPLLEQRRHIESQRLALAAAAQAELKNAKTRLDELKNVRLEGGDGAITASEFQVLDRIQSQITQIEAAIVHLREAATITQTELQEATRECKIVEHLRERRLKAHNAIQIRAEQRDIEESNKCRPSGPIML